MKRIVLALVVAVLFAGCGNQEAPTQEIVKKKRDFVKEGIQYLNEANVAAAIRSFDEAIRSNPRDLRAYTLLGQVYMHMKQYNRAIDTYNAASRIAPNNGEILYFLAMNHGLAGNMDFALSNAKKSVEIFKKTKDEEAMKRSLALWMGLTQSVKAQEEQPE